MKYFMLFSFFIFSNNTFAGRNKLRLFVEPSINYSQFNSSGQSDVNEHEYTFNGASFGLKAGISGLKSFFFGAQADYSPELDLDLSVNGSSTNLLSDKYSNRLSYGAFIGLKISKRFRIIASYDLSSKFRTFMKDTDTEIGEAIDFTRMGASVGFKVAKMLYVNVDYYLMDSDDWSDEFSSSTYYAGISFPINF